MCVFTQSFHQKCWFGKIWTINIPVEIPCSTFIREGMKERLHSVCVAQFPRMFLSFVRFYTSLNVTFSKVLCVRSGRGAREEPGRVQTAAWRWPFVLSCPRVIRGRWYSAFHPCPGAWVPVPHSCSPHVSCEMRPLHCSGRRLETRLCSLLFL